MSHHPRQQQEEFFQWFTKMGVHSFDIQVREPISNADDSLREWRWLKPTLGISVGDYFLKYSSWAKFMNSKGGDIYIRPHGESKHRVIFLDDLSLDKAIQVSEKYAACVVCTSKDNTQVWLATEKELSKLERKAVQSWMRSVGYTDPGSVSGDHLGRLCGVRSQKRNCWVNLTTTTYGQRYAPDVESPLSSPLGEACASHSSSKGTQGLGQPPSPSEDEFGWVMGALKHGVPIINVINQLTDRAKKRGKRLPDHYAERTVMHAYRVLNPT
jgi:hypothetical protein